MSKNSEMTKEKITRYCDAQFIDFVNIEFAMQQNARIKAGMLTRIVGEATIMYPDIIDLLASEQLETHIGSTKDLNMGRRKFVPMQVDTYFCATSNQYRNVTNQQTQSNYITTGYGLYYHRTQVVIEEDDEYFYMNCSFDLYIDDRLTTPRAGTLGLSDESYLINPTITSSGSVNSPSSSEDDTQLVNLSARLRGVSTPSQSSQRSRYGSYNARAHTLIPKKESAVKEFRRFLLRDRFPLIRRTAMMKTRVPNALHSCVAIKKTMKMIKAKDTDKNLKLDQAWFLSTKFTTALRDGRLKQFSKDIDYSLQIVGNGVGQKRHTMRFAGLIGEDNRYLVANIISTDEVPDDLHSILKSKVSKKKYPKTRTKRLLNVNALLATYTTDEFNEGNVIDITNVLPPNAKLTLVRIGACEPGRTGETLIQYCAISDGVYEINIPTQSFLRKDKKKMKLEPGKYVICMNEDETDLIKYNELVSTALTNIYVDAVRSRLTMTKGSGSAKFRIKSAKRAGLQKGLTASKSKATQRTKKLRASRARSIFGKRKSKNKDNTVVVDDEERETLE
jgi:hypothetical protein